MKYSCDNYIWYKLNGIMTLIPLDKYMSLNNVNLVYIISLTNQSTKKKLKWYIDAPSPDSAIKIVKSLIDNDENYIINIEHRGYKQLVLTLDKLIKKGKTDNDIQLK